MSLISKVVAAAALPIVLIAVATFPAGAAVTTPGALTADQIASRANADLKAAKTYHIWGPLTEGGSHGSLNVTRGRNGCEGTFSFGSPPITFVEIGSKTWIEFDGQWIQQSTSSSDQMLTFCNPKTVASLVDVTSGLTKGRVTVVSHQRVQELSEGKVATIYVTTATKPEYVRFVVSGHDSEQLNFSGINASVTIKPPATSG